MGEEMVFRTFVEAGRIAYINYGSDFGKAVVIVDWADAKQMLVEGPKLPRCMYPLRRLQLTKQKVKINRGARSGAVRKMFAEVAKKFDSTSAAKKMAVQNKRAELTDFDRFSVMINRKQRAHAVRKAVSKQLNPKKGKGAAKAGGKKK